MQSTRRYVDEGNQIVYAVCFATQALAGWSQSGI